MLNPSTGSHRPEAAPAPYSRYGVSLREDDMARDFKQAPGLGYNLIDRGKRFITIKLTYHIIEERYL
jgi:hypothetical protein